VRRGVVPRARRGRAHRFVAERRDDVRGGARLGDRGIARGPPGSPGWSGRRRDIRGIHAPPTGGLVGRQRGWQPVGPARKFGRRPEVREWRRRRPCAPNAGPPPVLAGTPAPSAAHSSLPSARCRGAGRRPRRRALSRPSRRPPPPRRRWRARRRPRAARLETALRSGLAGRRRPPSTAPSAVLPPLDAPASARNGQVGTGHDHDPAVRTKPDRPSRVSLTDTLDAFGLTPGMPRRLVGVGAAIAGLGFLLPWANVLAGSGLTGDYWTRWALAGPGHRIIVLALAGLLGLAVGGGALARV